MQKKKIKYVKYVLNKMYSLGDPADILSNTLARKI